MFDVRFVRSGVY